MLNRLDFVPAYGGRFKKEKHWYNQRYWLEDICNDVLVSAYYTMQVPEMKLVSYLELKKENRLFVDSGGFTELTKGMGNYFDQPDTVMKNLDKIKKEYEKKQISILKYQEQQNADVAFTLDIPLLPKLDIKLKKKLIEITKNNAKIAFDNRKNKNVKLYPVVQSWSFETAKDLASYYQNLEIDGMGVGGLVPYSSNLKKRLEILIGVRSETTLPIHALGTTGIPHLYALAAININSVDSKTYADYSRFRHFINPQTNKRCCVGLNVKTEKKYRFEKLPCNCQICQWIKDNKKELGIKFESDYYAKSDSAASSKLALHNLMVIIDEVNEINEAIKINNFDQLVERKRSVNRSIDRAIRTLEKLLIEKPKFKKIIDINL